MLTAMASKGRVSQGLGAADRAEGSAACCLVSFQVEVCTGAMFMGLMLGLDVYQATMVLLMITGIYMITGEGTLSTQGFMLTPKLCLLVESWWTLGPESSAFAFSYV